MEKEVAVAVGEGKLKVDVAVEIVEVVVDPDCRRCRLALCCTAATTGTSVFDMRLAKLPITAL